jgi:hypothetical protein
MSIQLVSLSDARTWLDQQATHTDDDTLITDMIQKVSGSIERYLHRELENTQAARVEYFSGDGKRRIYPLRRFPIATVTSVYDSADRSYGSGDLIASDDYAIHAEEGFLEFEYPLAYGVRNVKISYNGGYTASSGVLPVPDGMKHACLIQVTELYRRRTTLTQNITMDLGNAQSPVTFDVMDLLPGVKRLLDPYRVRTCL